MAAVANTRGKGSSPQVVCEFLRKLGVPHEEEWPFTSDINTEDKYFAPLPPKLYDLAAEVKEEWIFKHEYVPSTPEAILKASKCSPLGITVVAWRKKGGLYYKPKGARDNHMTTLIKPVEGKYKRVFDSYDSFIKDYEWDTKHSAIKRFYVKRRKGIKACFLKQLFIKK